MFIDLDWQKFVINADENVHCMVKPLEMWAVQKVMTIFKTEISQEDGAEKVKEALMDSNIFEKKELHAIVKEVLPQFAKDLTNVEIRLPGEEKRDATIEDVAGMDLFIVSSISILMHAFSIASLNIAEVKELKKK
jgi:hypothetical protein